MLYLQEGEEGQLVLYLQVEYVRAIGGPVELPDASEGVVGDHAVICGVEGANPHVEHVRF